MQLRQRILDSVDQAILSLGKLLPPKREIATITVLSQVTVHKAMQALAKDGVILQKQESKSWVLARPPTSERAPLRLTSFPEYLSQRGLHSSSWWLEREHFMPSPDEVITLELAPKASVARTAGLQITRDQPLAIERATLTTSILTDPLSAGVSLYATLQETGARRIEN